MRSGPRRFARPLVLACLLGCLAELAGAAGEEGGARRPRVESFISAWAAAWSKQEPDAYFAFYASDCVVDGRDRADFEAHKRRLFSRALPVTVRVGDLRIGEAALDGEPLVRASFDQEYASSRLADFGRKDLLLRAQGESFVIVAESWTPGSGVIRDEIGPQPAPAGDEPLLGSGYVPPAADASATPAAPAGAASSGDALVMDPLLGRSLDVVEPDYGLPAMERGADGRAIVEEIAASVNGQILTRTMLVQRIGWYEGTLLEDNPPDLEERLGKLAEATLDATIDRWLILQEARSRSADVEGFWREWLAQFRRQMEAPDLDALEAMLKEQGSSLEQLRSQVLETEVPNVYLQQAIGEELTFTEAEIQARFDASRPRYERPKSVTLRQVLIPVASGDDPARARAVADAAVSALRDGKDWCEVHEIYSSGGPPCGDIGSIAVDDLLPELREAAVGVPVGAVTVPILSPQGWHVLRVVGRAGMEPVELADVRDRVLADLRAVAYERQMHEYLAKLRSTGEIRVNPRYGTERDWASLAAPSPAGQ